MMDYILLILLFIITFITINLSIKFRVGNYRNPVLIYSAFWIIFIIISIINPLDLYTVSIETYLLLLLSIVMVSLGFMIFVKPNKTKKIDNSYYNTNSKADKYMLIFQIIYMLILFVYYYKYKKLLLSMGIHSARTIVFTQGYLFKFYFEYLLYTWILTPSIYLIGMICIYKYIVNKKINILLIISILNIFIHSSIGNGRMIIFDFICYTILLLVFNNINSHKITNVIKVIKIRYIIVFLLALYFITLSYANRVGIELSINNFGNILFKNIEQGILYFTGPFVALDTFLDKYSNMNYAYTIWKCTFSGISEVIGNILLSIGINFNTGANIIGDIATKNIYISQTHQFNAFYTSIFNFYLDAGLIGIIIYSFLFGTMVAVVFNRYTKNKNIYNTLLLVYMTWIIMVSVYRLPSSFETVLITFILIYLSNKYKFEGVQNNESIVAM